MYSGEYKNGKKDGNDTEYFLDNNKKYNGEYKNGGKNGIGKEYDENGNLK